MSSTEIVPWESNSPVLVPKDMDRVDQVAPLARQLRRSDIEKIVRAFDAGLFDLAVEYVWTRTMSVLKRQLAVLGMSFIGELLARSDIDDSSSVEQVVTDYEAIQVAQQLGIVNRKGAMDLRHASEQLAYYSNPDVDDDGELTKGQALVVLQGCVSTILARENIEPAIDFMKFRRTLTQTILRDDDQDIQGLKSAPYFFKRTTVRVLLADARTGKGAQVENALGNLATILLLIWSDLLDPDRWQVGQAYAEAKNDDQRLIATSLQRILLQVRGFDYVPETLRSSTFSRAASEVLTVHEQMNNFYNEPAPMKVLASLGSTIPGPAFQICMQATLTVKLGNPYGRSSAAQKYADQLLSTLSRDRWNVYLDRVLPSDDRVLAKLHSDRPVANWIELARRYQFSPDGLKNPTVAALVNASIAGDASLVKRRAKQLREKLGG